MIHQTTVKNSISATINTFIKMNTQIIQITALRGPAECAWVVAKVLKYILKELDQYNISYQILAKENGTENGTVQSVVLQLQGQDLKSFLKQWIGTIQWIGTSNFRKHHKRKNWFIGCFQLSTQAPKPISVSDMSFQAIRSSGAGGQHVNKVSSAVRAKHNPTGLHVLVSDTRSQHRNKKIAIQRLQEAVAQQYHKELQCQSKNQWSNHSTLNRKQPVRVFKGSDFKVKKQQKSFKKQRTQLKNDLKKQIE